MITAEKLTTLRTEVFYKKASLLISSALCGMTELPDTYLEKILVRIENENPDDKKITDNIRNRIKNEGPLVLKSYLDLKAGRIESDFDFITDDGMLDASKRIVKNRYLLLDSIRSPYNLGAIARSAESFMIKELILVNSPVSPSHPKAIRTSLNTISMLKCTELDSDGAIAYLKKLNLPVFALECGGENISRFAFPDEGVCILGSEEFGVSSALMKMCANRLTIPLFGSKGSINVSVAAGIMLSLWANQRP